MGSRQAIVAILLAGCGRFGFDPAGEDAASSPTSMSLDLPGGGTIRKLTSGPDGVWYAMSERGQGYRSDDNQSWTPCGARRLTSIAVGSDHTVYGSGSDVAISTDRCATWVSSTIDRFTDHVATTGTDVLALADTGLRRRTGSTWSAVTTSLDGSRFVAYAGRPGSKRIAAAIGAGVVVSPDGIAWAAVTTGFPNFAFSRVAVSPTRMYTITGAGTGTAGFSTGGISCADGNGLVWTTCVATGGLAIAVDPTDDAHVVAGTFDSLAETTDAFQSVQIDLRETVGLDAANIYDLHFLPSGDLISASARGVFFSPGQGPLAFEPRSTGLTAWNIYGSFRDGDDVFLGTEGGVLRSAAGAPYSGSTSGMRFSSRTRALARAPDGSLIAVGRSLWRSADRAETWETLNILGAADVYSSYAVAVVGTRIYAGTARRLLYAEPPWTTWTPHLVGGAERTVYAIVPLGPELWFATSNGLFVSSDHAVSSTPIAAITAGCHAVLALPDGSLAAGCDDGVWFSDAARIGWQQRGLSTLAVRALVLTGTTVVAATRSGVHATTDGGLTWMELAGGEGLDLWSVLVDPVDGSIFYGGTGTNLRRTVLP